MRADFTRRVLSAGILSGAALCGLLFAHQAAAQQDDCKNNPNVWCGPSTNKRQPTPARTPNGRNRPRRPVSSSPSPAPAAEPPMLQLTMVRKPNDNTGRSETASLDETFSPNDDLYLSVKVRQNGYLYVIRQPSAGADGSLIFPRPSYKTGSSRVQKGEEILLPDCAYRSLPCKLNPPAVSASERLTVIFSQTPVAGLDNQAPASGDPPRYGESFISSLRTAPGQQQSIRGGGDLHLYRYARFVRAAGANSKKIFEVLTISKSADAIRIVGSTPVEN